MRSIRQHEGRNRTGTVRSVLPHYDMLSSENREKTKGGAAEDAEFEFHLSNDHTIRLAETSISGQFISQNNES
jgi:hypothetical protein